MVVVAEKKRFTGLDLLKKYLNVPTATNIVSTKKELIIDSGASFSVMPEYYFNHPELFGPRVSVGRYTKNSRNLPADIIGVGNKPIKIIGYATIKYKFGPRPEDVFVIEPVLIFPGKGFTLVSINSLTDVNAKIVFEKNGAFVYSQNDQQIPIHHCQDNSELFCFP